MPLALKRSCQKDVMVFCVVVLGWRVVEMAHNADGKDLILIAASAMGTGATG